MKGSGMGHCRPSKDPPLPASPFPTAQSRPVVPLLRADHRPTKRRKLHGEICHQLTRHGCSYKLPINLTRCPTRQGLLCLPDTNFSNHVRTQRTTAQLQWRLRNQFLQEPIQYPWGAHFLQGAFSLEDEGGWDCLSLQEQCQPQPQRFHLFLQPHRTIPSQLAGPTFTWARCAQTKSSTSLFCPSHTPRTTSTTSYLPSYCAVTFKKS